jgi:hypothetical protein
MRWSEVFTLLYGGFMLGLVLLSGAGAATPLPSPTPAVCPENVLGCGAPYSPPLVVTTPLPKLFARGHKIRLLQVDWTYVERCLERYGTDSFNVCFVDAVRPFP